MHTTYGLDTGAGNEKKLNIGELVTCEKLQLLGVDSVRIDKINDSKFEINFSKNGSYEEFVTTNT
jgi:hypothetical protein